MTSAPNLKMPDCWRPWLRATRLPAFLVAAVALALVQVPASAELGGEAATEEIRMFMNGLSEGIEQGSGPAGGPGSGGEGSRPKVYTDERPWERSGTNQCSSLHDVSSEDADSLNGGRYVACMTGQAMCELPEQFGGEDRTRTEIVRVDTVQNDERLLGFGCAAAGNPANTPGAEGEPVVITVTVEDFARMPVEPLVPHAGPPNGWVPVNMVNVLYVEPEAQTLDVELLNTPVQVRATPVSYHWDLGDGNTITSSKPGKPYPSEEVASEYTYEGWYDITLKTTFRGEFSVDGGEWQLIEGTIEVASDPVEIFAKSFESRLVDGEVPPDEEEDPWVPERSLETEGPQDPEARHREI